jgi:hypothetical protein
VVVKPPLRGDWGFSHLDRLKLSNPYIVLICGNETEDAVTNDGSEKQQPRWMRLGLWSLTYLVAPLLVTLVGSGAIAGVFVIPRLPADPPAAGIEVPDDPEPGEDRCYVISGAATVDPEWPLYVAQQIGSAQYQVRPVENHANDEWSIKLYFGETTQDQPSMTYNVRFFYLRDDQSELLRLTSNDPSNADASLLNGLPPIRSGDQIFQYRRLASSNDTGC